MAHSRVFAERCFAHAQKKCMLLHPTVCSSAFGSSQPKHKPSHTPRTSLARINAKGSVTAREKKTNHPRKTRMCSTRCRTSSRIPRQRTSRLSCFASATVAISFVALARPVVTCPTFTCRVRLPPPPPVRGDQTDRQSFSGAAAPHLCPSTDEPAEIVRPTMKRSSAPSR